MYARMFATAHNGTCAADEVFTQHISAITVHAKNARSQSHRPPRAAADSFLAPQKHTQLKEGMYFGRGADLGLEYQQLEVALQLEPPHLRKLLVLRAPGTLRRERGEGAQRGEPRGEAARDEPLVQHHEVRVALQHYELNASARHVDGVRPEAAACVSCRASEGGDCDGK